MTEPIITPDILLRGYAAGIFPMAEGRDDPKIHWIDPRRRGILPLDGFHISRSLRRRLLTTPWQVRADTAFAAVLEACADRDETWINDRIFALYLALHHAGFAHCVEVWDGPDLVGGVYGVTLGRAFFGESMFSRRSDASKVALAHAVHRLRAGGFALFDTQFLTPHLKSLGGIEVSRAEYRRRLAAALSEDAPAACFAPRGYSPSPVSVAAGCSADTPSGVTQRNTQTS